MGGLELPKENLRRPSKSVRIFALKANIRAMAESTKDKKSHDSKKAESDGLSDAQKLEQMKASILALQKMMESTEKNYKEHVAVRRMTPRGIFSSSADGGEYITENEQSINWIDRAEQELKKTQHINADSESERAAVAAKITEKLNERLKDLKEQQQKQAELFAARPKFKQYFYSVFGKILNVTALNDSTFAIFNSVDMLEIWTTHNEKGTFESKIKKLIDLPCTGVTHILHLYDGSYSMKTEEVEETRSSKMKSSQSAASRQSSRNQTPSESSYYVNENEIALTENKNEKWKTNDFNRPSKRLINWKDLTSNRTVRMNILAGDVTANSIYDNRYFSIFFIGCASGDAWYLEVHWSVDPQTNDIVVDIETLSKKKISEVPVKNSFYYRSREDTSLVVCEICTITGEHVLEAFKPNFDIEWFCKCDAIRLTSLDHQPRIIDQDRLDMIGKIQTNFKDFETMEIVAYCYDEHYENVLMALRSGILIRVNFDYVTVMKSDEESTEPIEGDEDTNPEEVEDPTVTASKTNEEESGVIRQVKQLKISWVFDANLPESVNFTTRRNSKINDSGNQSRPEAFQICGLKYLVSHATKRPQLLLSCDDGYIRVYPNEETKHNAKVVSKTNMFRRSKVLSSQFEVDEYSIGIDPITHEANYSGNYRMDGSVCIDAMVWKRNYQLLLGFTSKSTLLSYNIHEPSKSMLDIKVNTERSGILNKPSIKDDKNLPKTINIIDEEQGLGLIYHGRECLLFDFTDLMQWMNANSVVK